MKSSLIEDSVVQTVIGMQHTAHWRRRQENTLWEVHAVHTAHCILHTMKHIAHYDGHCTLHTAHWMGCILSSVSCESTLPTLAARACMQSQTLIIL